MRLETSGPLTGHGNADQIGGRDISGCNVTHPRLVALPSNGTARRARNERFNVSSLFRNGTLVPDDYAMYDTIGAPSL